MTTNEMSRNVAEASEGRNEIVLKITDVAQAAQSTSSGATQTQAAAQELARMAGELHCAVSQFTVDDGMDRHASAAAAEARKKGRHATRSGIQSGGRHAKDI